MKLRIFADAPLPWDELKWQRLIVDRIFHAEVSNWLNQPDKYVRPRILRETVALPFQRPKRPGSGSRA
jgi:hypothetical protein